ncbi:MAG: ATP-grasp domain-containing protein, partial [Thermoplasmata archaeon]
SIVMEFVPGTEYSVYGLSGRDGKPIVVVPVRRIQAVSESKKAEVVADPGVQRVVTAIVSKLGLVGPWNVQVMKSGSRITLIEVNPRFAGTTSLVVAAGVNLPALAIRLFLGRKIARSELHFRDGLLMTRYNEEIFRTRRQLAKRVG